MDTFGRIDSVVASAGAQAICWWRNLNLPIQTNANFTKNHSHIHASTRHQDPATSLKQNMSTVSAVSLSECTRNLCKAFHAPKGRKNCGARGGWRWMALDDVELAIDDGVEKWSEERWADAVFALGVKLQAFRRGWARYVVEIDSPETITDSVEQSSSSNLAPTLERSPSSRRSSTTTAYACSECSQNGH